MLFCYKSLGKRNVAFLLESVKPPPPSSLSHVTLLATTSSGLQNQLNCLRDCCVKMGMELNEGKTKVMVFRKGGHLGKHEKWYYAGKSVNVINSYTYCKA